MVALQFWLSRFGQKKVAYFSYLQKTYIVCQNLLHNPVKNASWLHFLSIVLIQVLPHSSVTIAAPKVAERVTTPTNRHSRFIFSDARARRRLGHISFSINVHQLFASLQMTLNSPSTPRPSDNFTITQSHRLPVLTIWQYLDAQPTI